MPFQLDSSEISSANRADAQDETRDLLDAVLARDGVVTMTINQRQYRLTPRKAMWYAYKLAEAAKAAINQPTAAEIMRRHREEAKAAAKTTVV